MHLQMLLDLGDHANFTIASRKQFASWNLDMEAWHSHAQAAAPSQLPTNATWSAASAVAQLIQDCEIPGSEACKWEGWEVVLLLVFLSACVIAVIIVLACCRVAKENDSFPLCPQFVVKNAELMVSFPLDGPDQDKYQVVERVSEECLFKAAMDSPSPRTFGLGSGAVSATIRLQNDKDYTIASVVVRSSAHAMKGQGIALCRADCEIFGFIEPDGPEKYQVRHRSGLPLLTLVGDFADIDVIGISPGNSKACWFKSIQGTCTGQILQHVDAGLVICSLFATRLHRRLTLTAPKRPLLDSSDPFLLASFLEDAIETQIGLPEAQLGAHNKPYANAPPPSRPLGSAATQANDSQVVRDLGVDSRQGARETKQLQ